MGDDSTTQKVQDDVDDSISSKPCYRPRYGRGFNRKRDSFVPMTTRQFSSDRHHGHNGFQEYGPESQRGSWRPPIPGRGRRSFSRGASANPNEQSPPFVSSPPPFPFPFPKRLSFGPGGHNVGMMSSWGHSGMPPVGIGIGNGLFLEQFRYPGHQQAYQAPKFNSTFTNATDNNTHQISKNAPAQSDIAETQSEEPYSGPLIVSSSSSASASVSSVKKKKTFTLRGDAPEFIPLALRRTSSRNPTPAASPRPKAADSWAQVEMWREKYDKYGRPEGY